MKRQRGRGGQRKPGGGGGYQPNRAFESNGPDVKVRGPAAHIYEKYMQLARDASSAGDRVQAENYLQHAEHYYRVVRAMQPVAPPPQFNDRFGSDLDLDGEGAEEAEAPEGADGEERAPQQGQQGEREWRPRGEHQQRDRRDYQQREQRGDYQQRDRGEYQPREQRGEQRGDYPREQQQRGEYEQREQQQPRDGEEQQGEFAGSNEEGEGQRRPRRRRNRFRADGERGPREGDQNNNGPVEGFGDSVPAFVGND